MASLGVDDPHRPLSAWEAICIAHNVSITGEISKINSERKANSEARRMDSQRAAGQGDAKAHSKTHRAP